MAHDKYRQTPQSAPLFHTSPSHLLTHESAHWSTTRSLLSSLTTSISPEHATFHNSLLPIEHNTNTRWSEIDPDFYKKVSPDPELRQAALEAQKLASRESIACSMRGDVFRLVDAVFRRGGEGLDPESWRVVVEEWGKGVWNGLGLGLVVLPGAETEAGMERYKVIKERLGEIGVEYQKCVDESEGGVWFAEGELEGLGEEVVGGLERGTGEGGDGEGGMVKVEFKSHDGVVMELARNPETRKRFWIGFVNRCNENIPRFQEIMKLRHEAARLVGYANHAAKRLEGRMAKTPDAVMKFLNDLISRAAPRAREQVAELLALKEADLAASGVPFDGNLYVWDLSYYGRLLVKKKYNVDHQKIAEYFPVHKTMSGMLRIFGLLLGLVFVELTSDEDRGRASPTVKVADILWHESVVLYAVWDEDSDIQGAPSEFVGYLYLDLHPRPGKYGHACCATMRSGFQYPDGTRCYPATCLIANLTPPTTSKPSLLKYSEVVTLFHELGHGMHDLVSRTVYSRFHGVQVARDFIEAPSQMLENWCRIPSCLAALSSHYETGEPLPQDMLEALIESKRETSALSMIDQLSYATFDMAVHTYPVHKKEPDYAEIYGAVYREVTRIKGFEALGKLSEFNHGYAASSALIWGNDAGYYGYLWSQVYSADMFHSAFKEDPMNREAGRRYRKMVLEKGGAQDEMSTLQQFLGREPSSEPFFRDLGW